jgi:membrane protein required for colicin V production
LVAIDWAIIAVLGISILVAAAQGFFYEVFSLAGVVFGYILAAWEYWRLAPWYLQYVKSQAAANVAGFITIFVFVAVLAGIAGKITRWAMKEVGLRWADRLLGAAFGLVRGVVVVSVGVLALATFYPDSGLFKGSELGRYFLVTARAASWVAPSDIRHMFHDGASVLRTTGMDPGSVANPNDKKLNK